MFEIILTKIIKNRNKISKVPPWSLKFFYGYVIISKWVGYTQK